MQAFSGNDTKIPDHAIERIARCLLPMIRAYYESAEGQAELAEWSECNYRVSENADISTVCW